MQQVFYSEWQSSADSYGPEKILIEKKLTLAGIVFQLLKIDYVTFNVIGHS